MDRFDRRTYYSVVIPAAGVLYIIVMFLVDWNGIAVVVGAMLIGLLSILGRLVPLPAGVPPRDRNRDR